MEGTSSYGFQRHNSAGTEATAMEHRFSFRDRIYFLDMDHYLLLVVKSNFHIDMVLFQVMSIRRFKLFVKFEMRLLMTY